MFNKTRKKKKRWKNNRNAIQINHFPSTSLLFKAISFCICEYLWRAIENYTRFLHLHVHVSSVFILFYFFFHFYTEANENQTATIFIFIEISLLLHRRFGYSFHNFPQIHANRLPRARGHNKMEKKIFVLHYCNTVP